MRTKGYRTKGVTTSRCVNFVIEPVLYGRRVYKETKSRMNVLIYVTNVVKWIGIFWPGGRRETAGEYVCV